MDKEINKNNEYANPNLLVDTAWLNEHMCQKDLRIVDCDVLEQYKRAHIPGAVIQKDHYQKGAPPNHLNIMGPTEFSEMAKSLGIGEDTLVIAYDNSRGVYAARLWWALNYYGHTNVKVLNGGWKKWTTEGRPITTDSTIQATSSKFEPHENQSLMSTTTQILDIDNNREVIIWDVRSKEEYTGENDRGNKFAGHIPGATHLEWLNLVDEKTHLLKPAKELFSLLGNHGITKDKRIHSY
jgi:thiosulfate/3-mercaptopyruvate sulfurtransferase